MQENDHSNPKQLKGFYGKVKVSAKALDILIVIGTVALFGVLAFAMEHRGYTISFDSTGGTVVEEQKKMYGDHVDSPKDPTREGYTFECWSRDVGGTNPWDMENDTVTESMTLYAIWAQE